VATSVEGIFKNRENQSKRIDMGYFLYIYNIDEGKKKEKEDHTYLYFMVSIFVWRKRSCKYSFISSFSM